MDKWNLSALYNGFDSDEFLKDFKSMKSEVNSFNTWAKNNLNSIDNVVDKAEFYINFQNSFGDKASKLMDYAQLELSADSNNTIALKYCDILEDILSDTTVSDVLFVKWIKNIENIDDYIKSSKILLEHEFFLKETLKESEHILSDKEEIILSKLKTTGSSSWTKLYDTITSTLNIPVEIKGEIKSYPLPAVRNMAYSSDKETRISGYTAEIKALESISQISAASLNGIKGEVITTSKLKNYSSPLEMTISQSRMDRESLDSMLKVMKESMPYFRKYFLKKAEILGHKNGLPFYDLFAPIGEVNMEFSYEEAKDLILENFSSFSNKLSDFALKAFENKWIDVYPREGKRGGAFCSNLHCIGESRILTNFTGSFSDVITIAHELGHGYHGEMLNYETYLNCDYPMPIAETASTFCETIVKNALLKKASTAEKKVILENDISDNAQIIVDIMSRFLFEDKVLELRKNGSLSVEELCEIMLDAQIKTYGEGLDKNYMHRFMWVCKPHYYDADYNYYNFPYAFGLLFAKGIYSKYINDKKGFCSNYDEMLRMTGSSNLIEVARYMNIDLHNIEFWRSSIDIIRKDIEDFCK